MSVFATPYNTKQYKYNYVQLCLQKPVKAYRLLTEWLHNVAILDPAMYTESETIKIMSNLYNLALKELSPLFIYHGFLYRNHKIFTSYFYLYSRAFIQQTLIARQNELLQKLKWQYELEDDVQAVNIILLQIVRKRLAGKTYIDPEPVLQYVLSKRKDKEQMTWQTRLRLWNNYNEQIIALYKKANPFLTDYDIWFLYLQIPINIWKKALISYKHKQSNTRKRKKRQIQQTNVEDIYNILTETDTKYDPLTVHSLFAYSMQDNNNRKTEKEINTKRETYNRVSKKTESELDIIDDIENVFSLP